MSIINRKLAYKPVEISWAVDRPDLKSMESKQSATVFSEIGSSVETDG